MKKLLWVLFIFQSCLNSKTILDKKFSFENIQQATDEIFHAYDTKMISEKHFVGLTSALMDYQPWYDYNMEEKTFGEIITDIPMFLDKNGIIEQKYNIDQNIEYEIINRSLSEDKSIYSVSISIKTIEPISFRINKLLMTVHDPIGEEKVILLYDNSILVESTNKTQVVLNFKLKKYIDQIGRNSKLGGIIHISENLLIKYASFKIFCQTETITSKNNNDKKLNVHDLYPTCSFIRIIEELNIKSGSKLVGNEFRIMDFTCE